ncbi:MAG: diphthine--ammonia ligase [Kiritimatiellia bacterium]
MGSIENTPFFCSWSGGKDSCLALYHAMQNGGRPQHLLTMLTEDDKRSRSHGLPLALIQQQSQSLSIPLVVRSTSWDDYEQTFISLLSEFKQEGIETGIFGDIDLDAHRQWCERVCSTVDMRACHPLWQKNRRGLLNEFLGLGFKATIISVKEGTLDKSFLGRILNENTIKDIENAGIDASGEAGEYHTMVTDGPVFSSPVHAVAGDQTLRDGYCFLDVSAVSPDDSDIQSQA